MSRSRFHKPAIALLVLIGLGVALLLQKTRPTADAETDPVRESAVKVGDAIATPAPAVEVAAESTAYRIALTDRLRVEFANAPDLSTLARVNAQGSISLPLIRMIPVSGLTLAEAEQVVAKAYRAATKAQDSAVKITVEEYAPREIIVQGEVVEPGRIVIPLGTTLSVRDAIVAAGGFISSANTSRITVTRRQSDGTATKFVVDPSDLLPSTVDPQLLQPDDIVFVPMKLL